MNDILRYLVGEANCHDEVSVRLNAVAKAYIVTHRAERSAFLSIPEREVAAGLNLRVRVLEWLAAMHDREQARA